MKVKLELKQITKGNMATVITITGVAAILCVVAFLLQMTSLSAKWHIKNYAWDVWPLFLSFVICFLFA